MPFEFERQVGRVADDPQSPAANIGQVEGIYMKLIRQLTGVYLVLLGLAAAIHFVATQFYDPTITGDSLDIWLVLDVLMVIALVLVLATAIRRKQMPRNADEDGRVTREYLEANFSSYFGASLPVYVGHAGIRLLFAKSPPWARDQAAGRRSGQNGAGLIAGWQSADARRVCWC